MRVKIDGIDGQEHWVAAKKSLGIFNAKDDFVKCEVQSLKGRTEVVWIDKDSMKKRMCNSVAGVLKIGEVLGKDEQDKVIFELAKKLPNVNPYDTMAELREKVLNDTTSHTESGCEHGLLTLDINSIANMTDDQIVLLKERICSLPDNDFIQLKDRLSSLPNDKFMLFNDRIAELNDEDFMSFKDKIAGLKDDDFVLFSDRINKLSKEKFQLLMDRILELPEDKFMLFQEGIVNSHKFSHALLIKLVKLSPDNRNLLVQVVPQAR